MSYATGILNKRVTVLRRVRSTSDEFGRGSDGYTFEPVAALWAAVDFTRGVKAMREGALDAYDTVMIRLRWHPSVTRESLIGHDGKTYEIQSFHADRQRDTIQITATERPCS